MSGKMNESTTRISVDHFLAGLAFWVVLMAGIAHLLRRRRLKKPALHRGSTANGR